MHILWTKVARYQFKIRLGSEVGKKQCHLLEMMREKSRV